MAPLTQFDDSFALARRAASFILSSLHKFDHVTLVASSLAGVLDEILAPDCRPLGGSLLPATALNVRLLTTAVFDLHSSSSFDLV